MTTVILETAISPKLAREVLYFFDHNEGVDGGYTFGLLMELLASADAKYTGRIALGFGAEVAAFKLAKRPSGIDTLRIMASLEMAANS